MRRDGHQIALRRQQRIDGQQREAGGAINYNGRIIKADCVQRPFQFGFLAVEVSHQHVRISQLIRTRDQIQAGYPGRPDHVANRLVTQQHIRRGRFEFGASESHRETGRGLAIQVHQQDPLFVFDQRGGQADGGGGLGHPALIVD